MRNDNETREKIRQLCFEYDCTYGWYPESPWEGISLFRHFCERLGWAPLQPTDVAEWEDAAKVSERHVWK